MMSVQPSISTSPLPQQQKTSSSYKPTYSGYNGFSEGVPPTDESDTPMPSPVRCQYVSNRTRLQCPNLNNPRHPFGFCDIHDGFISRLRKQHLRTKVILDPGFKEEMFDPDECVLDLSEEEDEVLKPTNWPEYDDNGYCDDGIFDNEENPLKNAGIYTEKEVVREYIKSLERTVNSMDQYISFLGHKFKRCLIKGEKLKLNTKKQTPISEENRAFIKAARKFRNIDERIFREHLYYREVAEKGYDGMLEEIKLKKVKQKLLLPDDKTIETLMNELCSIVDKNIEILPFENEKIGEIKDFFLNKTKEIAEEKEQREKELPPHLKEIVDRLMEIAAFERPKPKPAIHKPEQQNGIVPSRIVGVVPSASSALQQKQPVRVVIDGEEISTAVRQHPVTGIPILVYDASDERNRNRIIANQQQGAMPKLSPPSRRVVLESSAQPQRNSGIVFAPVMGRPPTRQQQYSQFVRTQLRPTHPQTFQQRTGTSVYRPHLPADLLVLEPLPEEATGEFDEQQQQDEFSDEEDKDSMMAFDEFEQQPEEQSSLDLLAQAAISSERAMERVKATQPLIQMESSKKQKRNGEDEESLETLMGEGMEIDEDEDMFSAAPQLEPQTSLHFNNNKMTKAPVFMVPQAPRIIVASPLSQRSPQPLLSSVQQQEHGQEQSQQQQQRKHPLPVPKDIPSQTCARTRVYIPDPNKKQKKPQQVTTIPFARPHAPPKSTSREQQQRRGPITIPIGSEGLFRKPALPMGMPPSSRLTQSPVYRSDGAESSPSSYLVQNKRAPPESSLLRAPPQVLPGPGGRYQPRSFGIPNEQLNPEDNPFPPPKLQQSRANFQNSLLKEPISLPSRAPVLQRQSSISPRPMMMRPPVLSRMPSSLAANQFQQFSSTPNSSFLRSGSQQKSHQQRSQRIAPFQPSPIHQHQQQSQRNQDTSPSVSRPTSSATAYKEYVERLKQAKGPSTASSSRAESMSRCSSRAGAHSSADDVEKDALSPKSSKKPSEQPNSTKKGGAQAAINNRKKTTSQSSSVAPISSTTGRITRSRAAYMMAVAFEEEDEEENKADEVGSANNSARDSENESDFSSPPAKKLRGRPRKDSK